MKKQSKISISLNRIESNGLTVAQNRGKACSKILNTIQSNGFTLAQNRGKKVSEALKRIESNGLTVAQNRGLRGSKTKNLIEPNGLTRAKNRSDKAAETKRNFGIGEDGLTVFQRAGKKSRETRKKIGEDGLTLAQRLTQKMMKTMSQIGEDGLSGFERAFKNGAGRNTKLQYHSSGLCYQGSLEKCFLDLVAEIGYIEKVKKIKPISYEYKTTKHLYHADFCYNIILFEIKSGWTYDRNGNDLNLRKLNHIKWIAAISKGYKLCIIWDNTSLSFLDLNDFRDIEKSLYSTSIKFTKQALLDIFHKNVV